MNKIDEEILKELLDQNLSVYQLHKQLRKRVKTTYPTVLRHVNQLAKEQYILKREDGKRKTFILSLTSKAIKLLVMLIPEVGNT